MKRRVDWIIQTGVFEQTERIIDHAKEHGNVFAMSYLDLVAQKVQLPPRDSCVLCCGSIDFIRRIKREEVTRLWKPGSSWCEWKSFLCSSYYADFHKYLLNRDYAFMPMRSLIASQDVVWKKWSVDGKIFLRPDAGTKPFVGGLTIPKELEEIETLVGQDDLVVVSRPKVIIGEWRFVVINGQVISGARYYAREGDELVITINRDTPEEAYALAKEIAPIVNMPAVVIDIAQTESGYSLLEFNSFNSSDWYDGDIKTICQISSDLAWEQFKTA